MEGLEILKVLGAAGDLSTVGIVFLIYHNGNKIREWVRQELKPVNTAITQIKTILKIKEET